MKTILTIGGVDYDGGPSGRPGAHIYDMRWRGAPYDDAGGSRLMFTVKPCGTLTAPFVPGVEVRLRTTDDDGSNPVLRFVGDIDAPTYAPDDAGPTWHYDCPGLEHRTHWVAIRGLDGSGIASFNLAPDNPDSLISENGKTVGAILRAILESPNNAPRLAAVGVGNYASLSPPTLPAQTLADLAALSIVPNAEVFIRGESFLNSLMPLVERYHPQVGCWVKPDGTIRFADVFGGPTRTLTRATAGGGDPIEGPTFQGPDCRGCYSSWEIVGQDIQGAWVSVVQGTLVKDWTPAQEAAWTLADFSQPKGYSDDGALSNVTATSCTVKSDFAAARWGANFWNDGAVGGWIHLSDLSVSGVDQYAERQITSCSALSPGGTATIGWDPSQPLTSTSYKRYRINGLASPQSLVGRAFKIRDPATGATGVNTYLGSHLVARNSKGMPVAQNSRVFTTFYPYAFVRYSFTGAPPYFEVPIGLQVDKGNGRIVLTEPAVTISAAGGGSSPLLMKGYPTRTIDGLYVDVLALLPYDRGDLSARWPPTGEEGTANSKYGITRPKLDQMSEFTWFGDAPALQQLAKNRLRGYENAVIGGSVMHHGFPAGFDPFEVGITLSFTPEATPSPLDGEAFPVIATDIAWLNEGPDPIAVTFSFSNSRRTFEGDDLFTHPGLASLGSTTDDLFVGSPGMGPMNMGDYNDIAMMLGGSAGPGPTPLSALGSPAPFGAPGGSSPPALDADFSGLDPGEFAAPINPGRPPRPAPTVADAMLRRAQSTPAPAFAPVLPSDAPGQPIRVDDAPAPPTSLAEDLANQPGLDLGAGG